MAMEKKKLFILLGLCFVLFFLSACIVVYAQDAARISVGSEGQEAEIGVDRFADIDDDGRYAVFSSRSSNLVPNDYNDKRDIFLKNLQTNELVRINLKADGSEFSENSSNPVISSDGTFVAYLARSNELEERRASSDSVVLYNIRTGESEYASLTNEQENNSPVNGHIDISKEGRYVVFSTKSKVVEADQNKYHDVYLRDTYERTTTLITTGLRGAASNGSSEHPVITPDGKYIAYLSRASNLVGNDQNEDFDAFVYNIESGLTTLVSLNQQGEPIQTKTKAVSISNDGKKVAFVAAFVNPDTGKPYGDQGYVRDLASNTTTLVSVVERHSDEEVEVIKGKVHSLNGRGIDISGDGNVVAFATTAPLVGIDGSRFDHNVFIYELKNKSYQLVSSQVDHGVNNEGGASLPKLSKDGKYAIFTSNVSKIVHSDLNSSVDVFVKDFVTECGKTSIDVTRIDTFWQSLENNGKGRLNYRRLVTNQDGNLAPKMKRRFIQIAPMDIDRVTLKLQSKESEHGLIDPTIRIVICATGTSGLRRVLYDEEVRSSIKERKYNLYGIEGNRISAKIKNKSAVDVFNYALYVDRPGRGKIHVPNKILARESENSVVGFADLHAHQSGSLGFGKGILQGSIFDNEASPDCKVEKHYENLSGWVAAKSKTLDAPKGLHHDPKDYMAFDDVVHNKINAHHLKKAHEAGLRLMIASAVSNQFLCFLASNLNPPDGHCSDMESVKTQIYALKQFDKKHDWYQIVRDPWEARRAIAENKIAVILGIEASNIMPSSDGDWERQLEDFYDMGVRQIYLAHQTNSDFAGPAYHHWPAMFAAKELDRIREYVGGLSGGGRVLKDLASPFIKGINPGYNNRGLTSEGQRLVQKMIDLDMIIDIDHLSRVSLEDLTPIIRKNDLYPLISGHNRVHSLTRDKTKTQVMKEFALGDTGEKLIRMTGGIVGLRTGPDIMKTHEGGSVSSDCDGSVKSFLQSYDYLVGLKVKVAFGSDLNGFVPGIGPRFGQNGCLKKKKKKKRAKQACVQVGGTYSGNSCVGGAPLDDNGCPKIYEQNAPDSWGDYCWRGFANFGMYDSLFYEMRDVLGVDVSHLENSAESFLQVWERMYQN